MRWTVNSQMSTTLQSCLGSTLPTVSSSSMSSQSSQFSLWRSQRMCGANSQPVFVTAVTSQCRHLCRHCTIYKLFCLVGGGESAWRFRKTKDPFPRGTREEPHLEPDHAVHWARPAQLQSLHGYHQEEFQGEKELCCSDEMCKNINVNAITVDLEHWSRQIQPVVSAWISVHCTLYVMMPYQIICLQ